MKKLTVQTQEGIVFSLPLAGPVTRFAALVIDSVCVYILYIVVAMTTGALRAFVPIGTDIIGALSMIAMFLLSMGYWVSLEWFWRGQTPGKRFFRLRVMDVQGMKLKFSQIVIRNILRFVDSLPFFYLVGGVACFLTRHGQRLGDIAANTIVVAHPVVKEPDLKEIMPSKFNSFRDYPHLTARLRHYISPAEADIILRSLIRRNSLDAEARIKLYRELRSHIASLVEFPNDAMENISDEQYIRNVADILYR